MPNLECHQGGFLLAWVVDLLSSGYTTGTLKGYQYVEFNFVRTKRRWGWGGGWVDWDMSLSPYM